MEFGKPVFFLTLSQTLLMPLLLLVLFSTGLFRGSVTTDRPAYFIAMEYKGMSNCIYKVYVTDSLVMGAKVHGYVSTLGNTIPRNKLWDPEQYVDKKMDAKYEGTFSDGAAFLAVEKDNFIIRRSEIDRVYHEWKKKWGMGFFPYSGLLMIEAKKTETNRKSERELILMGEQNPRKALALFNANP